MRGGEASGSKEKPGGRGDGGRAVKGRRVGSIACGGLAEFAEGGAFGFVDLAVFVGVEAIAEGFACGFGFRAFAGGGADAVFHFFAGGGLFGFVEFAVAVLVEAFEHGTDAVDWAALRARWAGGFGGVGGRGDRLSGGVVCGE